MYRIVTLAVLRAGIDPEDQAAVGAASDVELTVGMTPTRIAPALEGKTFRPRSEATT